MAVVVPWRQSRRPDEQQIPESGASVEQHATQPCWARWDEMEELLRPWREQYRTGSPAIPQVPRLRPIPELALPTVDLNHATLQAIDTSQLSLPPLQKGLDLIHAYIVGIPQDSVEAKHVSTRSSPAMEGIVANDSKNVADEDPVTRHYALVPPSWSTFDETRLGIEIHEEIYHFDDLFNDNYQESVDRKSCEVLDPAFAARCHFSLLHGRQSNLFQWDTKAAAFFCTVPSSRLTGLSDGATNAVHNSFMTLGTNVRRILVALEHIRSHVSSLSPTLVQCAVFVEGYIEQASDSLRSLERNHLQQAVVDLAASIKPAYEILNWLIQILRLHGEPDLYRGLNQLTGSQILNSIEHQVRLQGDSQNTMTIFVRNLFTEAFRPFVSEVIHRVSVGPEEGEFLKALADIDGYDTQSIPNLLNDHDVRNICKIEAGLSIIKTYGRRDNLDVVAVPSCEIILSLSEDFNAPADLVTNGLRPPDLSMSVSDSLARIRNLPKLPNVIAQSTSIVGELNLDVVVSLNLSRSLSTQVTIINSLVADILHNKLKLVEHLEVLQQVFLLGNGHFMSNLSNALFASSVSSIGLNSTTSARWPPSSAKVNMATRHLLIESLRNPRHIIKSGKVTTECEILGYVGLAISSDEEHDDVPRTSLNALQFLQFSFRAQAPLDLIITQKSIQYYSRINQFLLVLLRLIHSINQMTLQARQFRTTRRLSLTTERFTMESSEFMRSFVAHVFETVIGIHWQSFMTIVQGRNAGIDDLHEAHLKMLHDIMHGCFISRKMRQIYDVLESIFVAILRFARLELPMLEDEEEEEVRSLYETFHKNACKFVQVVVGADTNKDSSSSAHGLSGRFDVESWQ